MQRRLLLLMMEAMMPTRAEAASSIWPHLPKQTAEPQARRRDISPLASAMYPSLTPKPPPPTPRPVRSIEEIRRDFSENMTVEFAEMVGFRKLKT
jgi:hypothetical protein